MQLQRRHKCEGEGGGGFFSNGNRRSGQQSDDVKPKQKQFRRCSDPNMASNSTASDRKKQDSSKQFRRCSDTNISEREYYSLNASDRNRLAASSSRLRGHFHFLQQLPFGSRTKAEAESSSTSPRHRKKSYSGSTPLSPPSPSSPSRSSQQQQHVVQHVVRRSLLPRQNTFSKGFDVKKHQLPFPPPRRMSHTRLKHQMKMMRRLNRVVLLMKMRKLWKMQRRLSYEN